MTVLAQREFMEVLAKCSLFSESQELTASFGKGLVTDSWSTSKSFTALNSIARLIACVV